MAWQRHNLSLWASQDWRMRDRLNTVSAALAICLNIRTDPPDSIKTNPCAKLEAWIDPTGTSGGSTKTIEQIGKRLQEQYETLSLRTRYKQYLDPSVDETKRFCVSLWRNVKDERVLFHYNGHGAPLPAASGELGCSTKTTPNICLPASTNCSPGLLDPASSFMTFHIRVYLWQTLWPYGNPLCEMRSQTLDRWNKGTASHAASIT